MTHILTVILICPGPGCPSPLCLSLTNACAKQVGADQEAAAKRPSKGFASRPAWAGEYGPKPEVKIELPMNAKEERRCSKRG